MKDPIERQDAIDALEREQSLIERPITEIRWFDLGLRKAQDVLRELPSAQTTLHGYNIEHLELIARVLQKENLPPERVEEALTDIGRIVAIVRDEFEETLRKAVQNIGRRTDDGE